MGHRKRLPDQSRMVQIVTATTGTSPESSPFEKRRACASLTIETALKVKQAVQELGGRRIVNQWVESIKSLELLERYPEYVTWYNQEGPHQGKGNTTLKNKRCRKWKRSDLAKDVAVTPRLGGLLKSYQRRAA